MGALCCVLTTGACLPEEPPDADWVDWQDIAGALAPEVGDNTVAETPGARIRVVSFNIEFGDDIPGLARAILDNDALAAADVFLVQELELHPGDSRSRAEELAEALAMNYAYAPMRGLDDGGTHGLAIFSRFPLLDVQVMQLPRFEIGVNSTQRIALAADIDIDPSGAETLMRVVSVHLDTRINITQRILQLRPAVVKSGDRAIIAGDMNTNPYIWGGSVIPDVPTQVATGFDQAVALDDYLRGSGFDTPTAHSGPTHRAAGFEMRLDAIYTRGLSLTGASGVERSVRESDHFPLWVDIAVE